MQDHVRPQQLQLTRGSSNQAQFPQLRIPTVSVASPKALNRLEPNLPMQVVRGCWRVVAARPLTIPVASALARSVANQFPQGFLNYESFTEIEIVSSLETVQPVCKSGRLTRYRGQGFVLDIDEVEAYCKVFLLSPQPLPGAGGFQKIRLGAGQALAVEPQADLRIGAILPLKPSVFVGGLVSISAEPPEGFFAASTSAELAQHGYAVIEAAQASVWLYRVPDSRPESYFEFLYPSPRRPLDTPREGKFLIASGVGPASDPASPGGREADLLWLGDEQHGPLRHYLETLARPDLRLSDLMLHRGLIQRLPDGSVLLSGPDQAYALSREGFNSLETDPSIYRQVYSAEYDEYLRTLFEPVSDVPAKSSYLLATSRGCTQGCSICCSGGLKAFQSFSADKMMEELEKVAAHAQLGADEAIDIFLLDSNFNNNPERIIQFAQLYCASPLHGRFRFYIRHNTVNGFLRPDGAGMKQPHLELIEAFRQLGVREVFMGVDTFDDNSTLTLKSNRVQLARKGAAVRPTYSAEELAELVRALEASGAVTKAFYLANNPWVSDLDRIDSYYNIAELWLENSHFSIDARHRDVNRLKPFAGSPIEQVSSGGQLDLVSQGRYVAPGDIGEMDEFMDMSIFGIPRYRSDSETVLGRFGEQLQQLRLQLEGLAVPPPLVMRKLLQRDQRFAQFLRLEARAGSAQALALLAQAEEFQGRWGHLPSFCPGEQHQLFAQTSASLWEGLKGTVPQPQRLHNSSSNSDLRLEIKAPKAILGTTVKRGHPR